MGDFRGFFLSHIIHKLEQKKRRNIVFLLILGPEGLLDLRGLCLLISEKYTVRISAKKSAQIPYPAFSFGLSDIYEFCVLGVVFPS